MKQSQLFVLLLLSQLACPFSGWAQEASSSKTEAQKKPDVQNEHFLEALDTLFPLDPEQIDTFKNRQNRIEEAITRLPAAKISSESRPLLLEPGQVPPPVILTTGYVGSIAFFDSTGEPWPISRAVIGNVELFNLVGATAGTPNEAEASASGDAHILYITPTQEHANSNILVHLKNAPNPVTIPLISDPSTKKNRRHQGITNFMVRALGPNAKPPLFTNVNPTINEAMMSFLDGIPPLGAVPMKITPLIEGIQAWKVDDKLYVRGVHTLIWPAYTAYAEGGGMFVYEMVSVPSIMVSINGTPTSVTVETEAQ